MAPLTAARLIHFDEKCGNGAISKGEKCTKGQSTPAQKVGKAALAVGAGSAGGYVLGKAVAGRFGKNKTPSNWQNTIGMKGKRTPSAQQMKNMKSAKVPRIGRKGAALIAGGALAAGALAALAMRKKKKATGKKSNFDPIAAAKAKEKQINN